MQKSIPIPLRSQREVSVTVSETVSATVSMSMQVFGQDTSAMLQCAAIQPQVQA